VIKYLLGGCLLGNGRGWTEDKRILEFRTQIKSEVLECETSVIIGTGGYGKMKDTTN